ncbi:MFS transporter [Paraburkholderia diazotrophica]|uniref:Predicted arabinose efflux permease, MFS family n=1 Tax=Paraburkholderia diazotrophica TaxID=667676 RepID=A0A1H6YXC5_9BURK|nr:MFS transporter [Paraburkholderia diazotrophica]SEJ45899.1 Predicted arabinose efflux permease, MFS family [Paraburkholderia diazotrophica]
MKQAHDSAAGQPCGAFSLPDAQPRADFIESGPSSNARVAPVHEAGYEPGYEPTHGSTHEPVPAPLPPVSSLRSTAILLLGYAILITGNGLLGTLISLRLIQQQAPSIVVGVVQSAYYVGFMLGAVYGGSLIGRVGHHRAFVTFAAASACCALGYAVWSSAATWAALRFITGFCLVGIFTAIESWLHQVASNAQRGRVFSAYLITNYLGVGTGQFLIGLADPAGFELFSAVSALFAASLIPVALAGTAPAPAIAHDAHDANGVAYGSRLARGLSGLRTICRWAPLGVIACLAAGLLNSAFYTMQPVFMRRVGYSVPDVSHFMGFALLAALVPQWPVARVADRFDRRKVLLSLAASAGTLSVLLFVLRDGVLIEALGYLYVAVAFSMYGVVASYVNDCIPADERIAVSAALLLIFSFGASGGPTLASAMMAIAGPAGLYLFTALVMGVLVLLTLRSLRASGSVRRSA